MKRQLTIILTLLTMTLGAQSLERIIIQATEVSPTSQIADARYTNAYWRYQNFLTRNKPRIDFEATLPDFLRALDVVTQPDGQDLFIERQQISSAIGLRLVQIVPKTGGTIALFSGLQRIDYLSDDIRQVDRNYLSTPINLIINQPLFQFNPYKWEKLTAPLELEKAEKQLKEDHAALAVTATRYYFDLLAAQVNRDAARKNIEDAKRLYEIGQRRHESGRLARADLLQLQLNQMNAETAFAENDLYAQTTAEQLRQFLGLEGDPAFVLEMPEDIPVYEVDMATALASARANRAQITTFKLQMAEAQQNLAQAKGDAGLNMDIFASFGLSQTANQFNQAFSNPLDQERVRIGLTVPIADWGKAKSQQEVARTNLELTEQLVKQDQLSFERDIIVRIQQLQLVRRQVNNAKVVFAVAQERLSLSRQRYQEGKIPLTEYNLAIQEETNARTGYINALRDFWLAHYEVRGLSMWDFVNGNPVERK